MHHGYAVGRSLATGLPQRLLRDPSRHAKFPQQAREFVKTIVALQVNAERRGVAGIAPMRCIIDHILPMSLPAVLRRRPVILQQLPVSPP